MSSNSLTCLLPPLPTSLPHLPHLYVLAKQVANVLSGAAQQLAHEIRSEIIHLAYHLLEKAFLLIEPRSSSSSSSMNSKESVGEGMMGALMAVAGGGGGGGGGEGSFLVALNGSHRLDYAIANAIHQV